MARLKHVSATMFYRTHLHSRLMRALQPFWSTLVADCVIHFWMSSRRLSPGRLQHKHQTRTTVIYFSWENMTVTIARRAFQRYNERLTSLILHYSTLL